MEGGGRAIRLTLRRRGAPARSKLPRWVSAKHLMKSSSTPPAEVTMTCTILAARRTVDVHEWVHTHTVVA